MNNDILNQIRKLLEENSIATGKEVLSLSGTAIALASIPLNATSALIQVESDSTAAIVMRFWENGSLPTSTDGMYRAGGDFLEILTAQNLNAFRAISIAGTTKLQITYYI